MKTNYPAVLAIAFFVFFWLLDFVSMGGLTKAVGNVIQR